MSGFAEKMRLKEMAEEDIYFARRDRELIQALHEKRARREGTEAGTVQETAKSGESALLEQRTLNRLKIVTGGQTGVDRAALDAAMSAGLATGGWCPRGRIALDGRIPERYPMHETPSSRYAQRTEWNMRDSDATLILARGALSGGTKLTAELAGRYGRPLFVVDLGDLPELAEILGWIEGHGITVLNVAGPREEGAQGIQGQTEAFLGYLFRALSSAPTDREPAPG